MYSTMIPRWNKPVLKPKIDKITQAQIALLDRLIDQQKTAIYEEWPKDGLSHTVVPLTALIAEKSKLDERDIARKIERLPKVIYAQKRAQYLEVSYMFDTVDRWYLSYTSISKFPLKKVFMHYEESSLDACVMKAWRHFVEHRNEWELMESES